MLSPISDILDDLRAGKMIILVDDESRENEGDLVCAAEAITPAIINFMVKHTPGYLCITLTGKDCDRLDLHPQTSINTALRGTAMAVSIDGHPKFGVSTGISASDRAKTVKIAVDPNSKPQDLTRPGHMVPLRARDGGVLVRTGQTEGSVDLMKLAGMQPVGVISEICREDGEMARMPELELFALQHDLKICSVEQIIHYRLERERLIHRLEPVIGTPIETDHGTFTLIAYQSIVDPLPHIALTVGDVGKLDPTGQVYESDQPTLVRVHRRNLLGDIFGDKTQPTNKILAASMKQIQVAGRGAIVYLRPSGVGEGLLKRLQTLNQTALANSHSDNEHHDINSPDLISPSGVGAKAVPLNRRDYGIGVQILRDLGLHKIQIITNNPKHLPNLKAFDLEVVESVEPEDY